MAAHAPPVGLSEQDFEAIEDAVMETARGRWFLREYARRMRAADTNRLLDAMARIERCVSGQSEPVQAQSALHVHVPALEERRDRLAELSASLREQGYDGDLCGRIAREALALDDIIADIRVPDLKVESAPEPEPSAPRSSDPAVHREDPHAEAPLTIEAVARETDPVEETATRAAPAIRADLSALEAVESLPQAERLALFS